MGIMKRDEVPLVSKVLDVMHALDTLRHQEIGVFDNDPVLEAATHLSIPLLLSSVQLAATTDFGAYVLSRHPRIPSDMRGYFASQSAAIEELIQRAKAGKRENYDRSLGQIVARARRRFVDLCAGDLCRQQGLDLQQDFLEPLKLLEMNLDYDPHLPTIRSRAASTNLPIMVRTHSGRLRFAQMALAQGSLTSAAAQEFGHVFAVHAHFMKLIMKEVENTYAVEMDYDGKEFILKNGQLNTDKLQGFIASNQLIQLLLEIIQRDYGDISAGAGKTFELFDLSAVHDLKSLSSIAYKISILMVDPAINEALVGLPDIEDAITRGVIIPKGGLYNYNQQHLLLRMGIRDRISSGEK